jgi:hypothetical protein
MNYNFYPMTNNDTLYFYSHILLIYRKNDPLKVPNYQLLHTTQNV